MDAFLPPPAGRGCLPFPSPLVSPQERGFAAFCGLLGGYRLTRLVLAAVRSGALEAVGPGGAGRDEVLARLSWEGDGGRRFLDLLCRAGLLVASGGHILLSPLAARFLVAGAPEAQLRTLEFEPRLIDNWSRLEEALRRGRRVPAADKTPEERAAHLALFLDAMDEAARVRSAELWSCVKLPGGTGTIVELGAGSGAYLAAFLERHPGWRGVFVDLPEVVARSRRGPRLAALKERVAFVPADVLAPGFDPAAVGRADALLLSNLVHCQGPAATRLLLERACALLADAGILVVHDFFHDAGWPGALYDLHMLVNTPEGRTYGLDELGGLLAAAGLDRQRVQALPSRSAVLLAARAGAPLPAPDPLQELARLAATLGFEDCRPLDPRLIPVRRWVRAECAGGCPRHGGPSCPPAAPDAAATEALLEGYARALLVTGSPPLQAHQRRLLRLEAGARRAGSPRALVLGSGPCTVCAACPGGSCARPRLLRHSMEACGIVVYGCAAQCGVALAPVEPGLPWVSYVGLLLVD